MTGAFTDGWSVRTPWSDPRPVTLPHDAMIPRRRRPDAPGGSHNSWFPGGRYLYERVWRVPAETAAERVSLFFEGVQGDTTVRVDGVTAARWNSGYREVDVPLDAYLTPGRDITIQIDVDHTSVPDARWYTGSGIYRDLHLRRLPRPHIVRDSLRSSFRRHGPVGDLAVAVDLSDDVEPGDAVTFTLLDGARLVAEMTSHPAGGRADARLTVLEPNLWSVDAPHLYHLVVRLVREGGTVDEVAVRTGLRTVTVDAAVGLRINGRVELLRGACIHHDNGILGAVTLREAEHRRVRLLKESGYNALRSAHNPASRHLLDACDELGMYLIDELTDVWFEPKTAGDSAGRFDESWRADALSMVRKDRTHPSVIMYSIGNENAETATDRGVATARQMSALLKAEDGTRPVTAGINFMLNAVASAAKPRRGAGTPQTTAQRAGSASTSSPSAFTSTMVNVLANSLGAVTQLISRLPVADRATRSVAAELDVVGYNYAFGRYASDARRHPERVMLGTESLPGDLPRIWPLVERLPALIGDFTWTGWDYLGEAGIGSWVYGPGRRRSLLAKDFPHLVAGPGAFDITGIPGAPVALQKATWGLLSSPVILVRPLDVSGEPVQKTVWRTSDAIASWSWPGYEGRRAQIEVYCSEAAVELFLNGRSLGRRRSGVRAGYCARFTTPYAPGALVAVALDDRGRELSRATLRSAGPSRLRLSAEPHRDGAVVFVWAQIADEEGTVDTGARARIELDVSNGAEILAFGSAHPAPEPLESFGDPVHDTYYGRALVAVRPPRDQSWSLTARSGSHGTDTLLFTGADATTGRLAST